MKDGTYWGWRRHAHPYSGAVTGPSGAAPLGDLAVLAQVGTAKTDKKGG
jgi:hypothetical protein